MKFNDIKLAGMLMAVAAGVAMTSCKDQPDAYEVAGGTPTISYIRPAAYDSRDSLITSAALGQSICIVGNNLTSVVKILFNDQSAVLNTSYMTNNTILLSIPKDLPGSVTNKIYFINKQADTVSYDFVVTVPAPVIYSMSNEWADPGEEVTILGDYFLDYEDTPLSLSFGEGYALPHDDMKISKNSIVFTMPDDAPEELINITTAHGSTDAPFMYKDTRGMLFDFDTPCYTGTVLGNNGWHARDIITDETALSGNFLLMGNTAMDAAGGWNDGNFSFEYWAGDWADPENYATHPRLCDVANFGDWTELNFKFEMYIPSTNPWAAAPMQVIFAGGDKIANNGSGVSDIYGITLAGANNTFFHAQDGWPRALYMPWNTSKGVQAYDTGDKWITVTIPLSDFNLEWDGSAATGSFSSISDFASLTLFIVKGGYDGVDSKIPNGEDCTPIIKIDNIRVVPNN